MRDQHQRRCAPQNACQALAEILRIQGGEGFIEHDYFGFLQQGTCQKDSAALALGKPPTGIADELIETSRHSIDEIREPELSANLGGLRDILRAVRIPAGHQQIENKRGRDDVVLVVLRRQGDAPAPGLIPQRRPIETSRQDKTTARRAQPARIAASVDLPLPELPSRSI